MDRNLLLAFALSFLVLSTWSMWQEGHRPPREQPVAGAEAPGPETTAAPTEGAPPSAEERYPALPAAEATSAAPPVPEPAEAPALVGERIVVERPLYRAELDTRGAVLQYWELEDYHDRSGEPVVLLDEALGVGDAGATPFLELGQGDLSSVLWSLVSQDGEHYVFELTRDGVTLRKTYLFPGGGDDPAGYDLRLNIDVENHSDASIEPRFLVSWPVHARMGSDFKEQALGVLSQDSVEKQPLASLGSPGLIGGLTGKQPQRVIEWPAPVEWAGAQTTYFLGALFPEKADDTSARFVVREPKIAAAAEVFSAPVQLPPGRSASNEYRVYVGPKETARLEALGRGAIDSIDVGYSVIAPLTRLFGWLLQALYAVIPNYGIAIIVLTVLVRAVTAPLTIKQMRSMERLRRVQPRMKEIQERYADDRQKQSEELMKLYRAEKVNPLGGCFPMLLQLPVFIGLFYALRSSIQLRQAPFVGWIDDLSAPDLLFQIPGLGFPVRVLPLLMGVSMVVQQRITPMQMDPSQARMMMVIMPVMMTVLFYGFPSGLVLYWMLSNLLAIGHQLWIGRHMNPSPTGGGEKDKGAARAKAA